MTMPGGGSADFAMLGLGIDATKAESGAKQFADATKRIESAAQKILDAAGKIDGAMGGTAKSVGTLDKALSQVAIGGLREIGGRVVSAAVDGIKKLGEEALATAYSATKLAARYEELGVVLTAVGRGAGQTSGDIAQLQKALEKTGISMIQSRQTILSMIQAHMDLSKATQLARAAQDVAVVGQTTSSDALQRMTQAIATGQVRMLHTLGIQANFKQAYEEYAKSIHKASGALTEEEKASARVAETLKKAATVQGAYEAAMTTAEKQSRSMVRYTEDLMVTLGELGKGAYTSYVFALSDAFKQASEWVKANKDTITEWATNIRIAMDGVIAAVKFLAHELVALFNFGGALKEMAGVLVESVEILVDPLNAARHGQGVIDHWDAMWAKAHRITEEVNAANAALTNQRILQQNILSGSHGPVNPFVPSGPSSPFDMSSGRGNTALGPMSDRFANPFGRGMGELPVFHAPPPGASEDEKAAAKAAKEAAKAAAAYDKATDAVEHFMDSLKPRDALREHERAMQQVMEGLFKTKATTWELVDAFDAMDSALRAWVNTQWADYLQAGRARGEEMAAALSKVAATANEGTSAFAKWGTWEDMLKRIRNAAQEAAERTAQVKAQLTGQINQQQTDAAANATRRALRGDPTGLAQFEMAEQVRRNVASISASDPNMQPADRLGLAIRMAEASRKLEVSQYNLSVQSKSWAGVLGDVAGTIGNLSSQMQGASTDAVRMTTSIGQSIAGLMQAIEQARRLKTANAEARAKGEDVPGVSLSQGIVAGVGGALGAFAGGYAAGTTTTSKGAGAGMGAASGALTGAAAGTAIAPGIGTAIGAAAGAVIGAIGGWLGAAEKGKQVAIQLNAAAKQLQSGLDGMAYALAGDALGAAIAGVRTQMEELRKQTEATYKGRSNEPERYRILAQIDQLEAQRIARLQYEAQQQRAIDGLSLDARMLRTKGLEQEATLTELAARQQGEMNAALAKYASDPTYIQKLQDVQAAERAAAEAAAQRAAEQKAFDDRATSAGWMERLLRATGDASGADGLAAAVRNEDELRKARERNLDVTLLLAAQEAEAAQRKRQEQQAETTRTLDLRSRWTTLTNGSIAGQLAGKEADVINRAGQFANGSQQQADEQRIGLAELNAMRAQFRTQAVGLMGGYAQSVLTNPVEQARASGVTAYADATAKLTEYLNAGIISQQEYATALNNVKIASDAAITAAERQQNRDQLAFRADLAGMQASLDPTNTVLAKAAYDAAGRQQYQELYDNARKLREAGTITQSEFESFTHTLTDKFSPAVRDAAFATENAARIMSQNMSTLSQQWSVFGTDAAGQLSDLTSLYGFGGLTAQQVQSMFTKATPGVELSATQLATNSNVSAWMNAFRAAQAASQTASGALTSQSLSPGTIVQQNGGWMAVNGDGSLRPLTYEESFALSATAGAPASVQTGAYGSLPTISAPLMDTTDRGTVLDQGAVTINQTENISAVQAMALSDIAASQLVVQRDIYALLKERMTGAPANQAAPANSGAASSDANRAYGLETTASALLVGGVVA